MTTAKARTKPKPAGPPSPHPIAEETLAALGLAGIYSPVAPEPRWSPWPAYEQCTAGARSWAPLIAAHVAAAGGARLAYPKTGAVPKGTRKEQLAAYRRMAGAGPAAAAAEQEPAGDGAPALDALMAEFNADHDAQDAAEAGERT